MSAETGTTVADNSECYDELGNLKLVNGLTKRVDGDVFDEWKRIDGHSFTAGFLVESLRSNDEEYKKLHGNRPVKDVGFLNILYIHI